MKPRGAQTDCARPGHAAGAHVITLAGDTDRWYVAWMDALLAQAPTIGTILVAGFSIWRSLSWRLDRLEDRWDRHLEWHADRNE